MKNKVKNEAAADGSDIKVSEMKSMSRNVKRLFGVVAIILGLLIVAASAYFIYIIASYYRVDDNAALEAVGDAENNTLAVGKEYTVMTYNLGFGAHSDDFSFFMDGGKYSRAFDRKAVIANTDACIAGITGKNPDFALLQEVDTDSTRSHHYNMLSAIDAVMASYSRVWAQNYDSAYLFYPFSSPIGASKSGIVTYSRYTVSSAVRRSLPIDEGFAKYLDLDRCYSVTRIACDNGRELLIYNLHLSAYSSDENIATAQLEMLFEDISAEYAKGNFVVCGGDFNKDLLRDSSEYYGVASEEMTWTHPFPEEMLPEGFKLVADNAVPSCRNIDDAYEKGKTYVVTIDGFIVSDNVSVLSVNTGDSGFENSDHNPVTMKFIPKAD